jgi:hypothetical protein
LSTLEYITLLFGSQTHTKTLESEHQHYYLIIARSILFADTLRADPLSYS